MPGPGYDELNSVSRGAKLLIGTDSFAALSNPRGPDELVFLLCRTRACGAVDAPLLGLEVVNVVLDEDTAAAEEEEVEELADGPGGIAVVLGSISMDDMGDNLVDVCGSLILVFKKSEIEFVLSDGATNDAIGGSVIGARVRGGCCCGCCCCC